MNSGSNLETVAVETNRDDVPAVEFKRLSENCQRGAFSCGVKEIDDWFKNKAHKRHRQYQSRVVTGHLAGNATPLGFFSLAIRLEAESQLERRRRHIFRAQDGFFATVQLEYIAVQRGMQRNGYGTSLLGYALRETYEVIVRTGICSMSLVSIDQDTTEFYKKLGFHEYGGSDSGRPKMLLPAAAIIELVETTLG